MTAFGGLARRIRLGEDSTLELKRILLAGSKVTSPRREDLADEVAAMANSGGGTILLGIDGGSRDVLGIPVDRLDVVEKWVQQICKVSVSPPVDAETRRVELTGASGELVVLVRIDVDRSLFVHQSPGGFYRRLGSSKRLLRPEVLARLFLERSQGRMVRFDESAVPRTSPGDLHLELVSRFLCRDAAVTEKALEQVGVVAADEGGLARVTVAGGAHVHGVAGTVAAACTCTGGELCRSTDGRQLSDRRT